MYKNTKRIIKKKIAEEDSLLYVKAAITDLIIDFVPVFKKLSKSEQKAFIEGFLEGVSKADRKGKKK